VHIFNHENHEKQKMSVEEKRFRLQLWGALDELGVVYGFATKGGEVGE